MKKKKKMVREPNTEYKIIVAARNVFQRRGFDGARMQEIADEAGINKAMLHYYYRSKDKLFEAVFHEALMKIFPIIFILMESEADLEDKIERFVTTYIDHIKANPHLPGFVIHEITTNPGRLTQFLMAQQIQKPKKFISQVKAGIAQNRYRDIDPGQFLVSVAAQCVFPFIAKPLVQLLLQLDEKGFENFIEQRKKQLPELILSGLRNS